ncbi:MAG: hypothetical protein EBZ59_06590 [Planctomycetia bacterium]|nr:hypothetical protein [Planctomycetia bacterium]
MDRNSLFRTFSTARSMRSSAKSPSYSVMVSLAEQPRGRCVGAYHGRMPPTADGSFRRL